MAKTLIKQRIEADITLVEGVKRLTGVTVVDSFEVEDEDGDVHVKNIKRDATEAELVLLTSQEAATLRSANQVLHEQNTAAQARVTELSTLLAIENERLAAATNALNAQGAAVALTAAP